MDNKNVGTALVREHFSYRDFPYTKKVMLKFGNEGGNKAQGRTPTTTTSRSPCFDRHGNNCNKTFNVTKISFIVIMVCVCVCVCVCV